MLFRSRPLQYFLTALLAVGIAWTTIDLTRTPLKLGIILAALAEVVAAVWIANLHGAYFSPFASIAAIAVASGVAFKFSQSEAGRRKRMLEQLLGDRVSKRTFSRLLEGSAPLKFDGELREATVLVCEITNQDELLATMHTDNYVAMTNAFLDTAGDFRVERGAYLDE